MTDFKRNIFITFLIVTLSWSASAQHLCAGIFGESSAPTQLGFLLEPKVKKDPDFKVPSVENYFTFPEQNLRTITRYTGNLYKEMNNALGKKEGLRDTKYLRLMDRMTAAMSALPWFEGTTYSGAALKVETFREMQLEVGKIFEFGYFFSTTKDKKIADQFIRGGLKKKDGERIPVLFSVKSKNGRDVTDHSFYDETEVLFKPETKFVIESVKPLKRGGLKGYAVNLNEIYEPLPKLLELPKKFYTKERPTRIEAQRFFEPQDWERASKERPNDPWNYFGKNTYDNWKNADDYLKSLPAETELSWNLYETVHTIVMKAATYPGWQRRMIREQFRKKIINESQAAELLEKIDNGEIVIDPPKIGTRYKSNDFFMHTGDQLTPDEQRYFTKKELELFQRNLFFSIDLKSVHQVGEDTYFAEVHYIYPENLKKTLSATLEEAHAMMEGALTETEYLWGVLKLQHALLSIHPFSDGNGRTIRLVSDWLLRKRNLAIPLRPISNELNITFEEYYRQTVNLMNAYIRAK